MTPPPLLDDLRVLDLTRILPGPFASLLLGDLGADVIKVEHPRGGDSERSSRPLGPDGEAYRFSMLNRGKRSIALDLKAEGATEVVMRLAERSDVLLEGFRPGVVDDLGIGYAAVAARNPRVVYCSLSGYGQTGPYAALPGHDINYQAMSGLLRYFDQGSGPQIPWLPIADIGGGALMCAAGVLAAMYRVARSGQGEHIDLGMAEGMLYWQNTRAQWWLATGEDPAPDGLPVTGALPGYGIYMTSDRQNISLGCLEPVFWRRLCDALELGELADAQHDAARRDEIQGILADRIATRSRDEWFDFLAARGVPVAPLLSIEETLANEHFIARGRIAADGGGYQRLRAPFATANAEAVEPRPAPKLGEHTAEILEEIGLGGDLDRPADTGVVP